MTNLIFSAAELRKLNTRLFEKAGVPRAAAWAVSRQIVENCLYGHDSHGMALVPRFVKDIEAGKIKPDAGTQIRRKAACARVDGRRGFGQLTMAAAVDTAVRIAKDTGVSAVTVTNCNHVGILWGFARTVAEKGTIGMIWCSSGPRGGLVAPYGGIKKAIGANPLAIGIPAGDMKPFVLDISTSATAGGKVVLYAQQGKKIPPGWLLDKDGSPTTDPNDFYLNGKLAGTLLPMAGYKGFGLGLAGEVLAGILSGYGPACLSDYKEGNAAFIVAINVARFVPLKKFRRQVDALFRRVKQTPTDPQTGEILIPGELEYRTREERERRGIPVTEAVWKEVAFLAGRFKIDFNAAGKENL